MIWWYDFDTNRCGAMCWQNNCQRGTGLAVTGQIRDIWQNILQYSLQTGSSITCSYFHIFFLITFLQEAFVRNIIIFLCINHHHPWIRSFDLFRHRRIAIVSWGVHDLFLLGVCSWGRVSAVWCCPFFRGGWFSFVCVWVSCLVFQRSPVLFLWLHFLFYPVLCIR